MSKKGNKVVMMPGRSADQLASQVARALRATKKEEDSSNESDDEQKENGKDFYVSKSVAEVTKVEESVLAVDPHDEERTLKSSPLRFINPTDVEPNPYQTRRDFSEKELAELSHSIAEKGLLQPIVVREMIGAEKRYQLIAGERRLRASEKVGLVEVPAIVQHISDRETLECSIVENAQREDLNAIEEARAYKLLTSEFNLNQRVIAQSVGKSRSAVANSIRLLGLDEAVIELIEQGDLSGGHGKALLGLDEADQLKFARAAIARNLSVRALEQLVQNSKDDEEFEVDEDEERIKASLKRLEAKIEDLLGLEKVNLSLDPEGRKKLSMRFETEASFKRFISKLRD